MQLFDQYDPKNPLPQQTLLKKWDSPQEKNGFDFYFLIEEKHILIYREQLHVYPKTSTKFGQDKLITNQLEMPLSAVRWYINVIEQKFFKPPEEGGLPADRISYREEVEGERLHVMRVVNAGCDHPGYDLTNLSRSSHILESSSQTFSASDPWLFEGGLMDFFKELADKYERGEL